MSHFKVKRESAALVVSFVWTYYHVELQQVIGIGEVCCAGARKIQLVDV